MRRNINVTLQIIIIYIQVIYYNKFNKHLLLMEVSEH